ncbi:DNA adenine methylase [Leptolyngbya sp. AN03gr2]|uniref:DNA adenine methylase n=1 Tax=unclassified Leptolyngbya TaxID=2650499 RepID=UPI003D3119A4
MPVPYFGCKIKLARWITSYFPNHSAYVEPFCGSASVFHTKRRSRSETLNDLYAPLINYHRCLRDDVERLIRTIEARSLTYKLMLPEYNPASPYNSASEFYLYCCRSFYGGGTRWATGKRKNPRKLNLNGLRGESLRLQNVSITQLDAIDVIVSSSDPDTLMYVDPPYRKEVRKSKDNRVKNQVQSQPRRQYAHELMQSDEHQRLLAAIVKSNSMLIVSGYDSQLYNDMLDGWMIVRQKAQKLSGEAEEVLWISPNAWSRLPKAQQTRRSPKLHQFTLDLS